jgi:hypothetical protein
MPTLDEIQKLDDGRFHRLCNDLLPRLDAHYRRLRAHGINPRGESIKGQPDSYVGDTATSCRVALCCTVQRATWWNKLIADVRQAVNTSPNVQEIVGAIPRDADREGPKKQTIDWLNQARTAAGSATFTVLDGPAIAGHLDRDHQDLRFEHLHIPYSRLCGQSILASCRRSNTETLSELQASGRYDSDRYNVREADGELFRMWQRAIGPRLTGPSSEHPPTRLIPLVNDSGIGKTSLLASFVRSLDSAVPVLLLQARNLSFTSEESLVAHAINVLVGVLEPAARAHEEAAIAHHLPIGAPLTVILDGLDEADDAELVRKALRYWLRSRLGQRSLLVTSSRPEFWKQCVDGSWMPWMDRAVLEDRSPMTNARRFAVEQSDPESGVRLPERFSPEELENAWLRGGLSREQLFLLPPESREELRHPFTLRVYLDLCANENAPSRPFTRVDLLQTWLNRRLDLEASVSERATRQTYQEALRIIAGRLAEVGGGSLAVDDLDTVPRFDAVRPPGVVVERLVAANILETVPGHLDRIRFAVEAVQDFYHAESEVASIVEAPSEAAEQFARLSFTKAYPRLARIGQRLFNEPARHEFARHLADVDARMAGIVIRADPTKYTHDVRRAVTEELGRQIGSRHRVCQAFAMTLLSDLVCPEATASIEVSVLPPADLHPYISSVGAMAIAKLGLVSGVELTYGWHRFGQNGSGGAYYFKEILSHMRAADGQFRSALAEFAEQHLRAESGTQEHQRAVCVLAYLRDDRLARHLDDRLSQNGSLHEYENHALVALGTEESGGVFYRSARTMLAQINERGHEVGTPEWHSLFSQVSSPSGDFQYLVTPEFEPHIERLITDCDEMTFSLGFDLALRSRRPFLVHQAVIAWSRQYFGGMTDSVREWLPPDTWLTWWNSQADHAVRGKLLAIVPLAVNGEIEEVLTDCLDVPELRSRAAWHLGHFGCIRSATRLREMLEGELDLTSRDRESAALALGLLRDTSAIETLRQLALAEPTEESGMFAVRGLGLIGTPEAERALNSLLGTGIDDVFVAGALMSCGSSFAVAKIVERARSRPDGPTWLADCMQRAFWPNSRRHVTEYYTHISTTELVAYLAEVEERTDQKWELIRIIEAIDSEDVRKLLRLWAGRKDSDTDRAIQVASPLRMSEACYDELMKRGDPDAIRHFVDCRAEDEDYVYVYVATQNLNHFPRANVADELRRRLASADGSSHIARLLSLLGRFGKSSDDALVRPYVDHSDDLIANVACETLLRLTDPMLVPDKWREL